MKCAYCKKDEKCTKEHIISCCILDLFPECYLTFDSKRNIVHESDPVIKDVCSNCNSKLSYIDSFAKDIICRYSLQDYRIDDELDFEYDYIKLQKVLLKYAYNDMRASKLDCSYFDEELINYLLEEENNSAKQYVSLFAGLAINTSPLPSAFLGNLKLQWGKDPVFLETPMIRCIDYETGDTILEDDLRKENFNDLLFSYIFRFNSIQFILLCWKKDSNEISSNNKLFELNYPYTLLDIKGKATLTICTNEFNYHNIMFVNLSWDPIVEIETIRLMSSGGIYTFKEHFEQMWKEEEKIITKEHPRKRT